MTEKKLIDISGIIKNSTICSITEKTLKINTINNFYNALKNYDGVNFSAKALKMMNIEHSITKGSLDNIPEKGELIIVSNHPTGALDGVVLIDLILKKRTDLKVLGNSLLASIEPLKQYVINVDLFSKDTKSFAAKEALVHLKKGGVLLVFPSAEVSTIYRLSKNIEDKRWSNTAIKFLHSGLAPILPIYIDAQNSKQFHIWGLIHPRLRTIQLARELDNKINKTVNISIGTPLTKRAIASFACKENFYKYIRNNIYLLKSTQRKAATTDITLNEIIEEQDSTIITNEINNIKKESLLFSSATYDVLLCKSESIPTTIKEIGRLREVTFRSIGEGSGELCDIDSFDNYYHQLIIWDNQNNKIIGGYRVGLGKDILNQFKSKEAFYCNTLFNINGKFESMLSEMIELGRSFIIEEYQRKPIFLLLLWRGLLHLLLQNEHYRYLFGPVSISGDYSDSSKRIIIDYIKKNHFADEYKKDVISRTGIIGIKEHNTNFINKTTTIDLIDKLVKDIDGKGVPILIKKYIQLGGRVIAFNVDKNFNYSLDAFLLVDIKDIPLKTLELLGKEMHIDNVTKRFSNNQQ